VEARSDGRLSRRRGIRRTLAGPAHGRRSWLSSGVAVQPRGSGVCRSTGRAVRTTDRVLDRAWGVIRQPWSALSVAVPNRRWSAIPHARSWRLPVGSPSSHVGLAHAGRWDGPGAVL